MEPPSLLSQQHSYALMHQQQQQPHQPPHQPPHQQQQQSLQQQQQQQQQPQAPGIYDPQQQQGGGQSGLGTLLPPLNSVMSSNPSTNSTIGQKRDFSGQPVNANSHQDSQDGGNFVKLFVGSVPRTITEEEVRPMFAEHGNVLEVALIKDKRTGQQQGCCFIKYGTIEEAERAIRALNNQRTLPGGTAPVQVRYADGERERLGAVEHKLFVGSLNKQASEKEIQELFAPYGRVDDVYIMRDEQKQSRGCAFIKYPTREMATAAISALNGIYIMPGCDQPLAVRFADPKRPKGGDTRVGGPGFGGPGFNSRPGNVGNRPAPAPMGQMGGRGPPMGWRPMGGPGMGPQAQMGPGVYGGSMGPRGVPANASMGGPLSAPNMNGHPQVSMPVPSQMVGPGMIPPAQQQILQGYYQQSAQRQPQSYGQQASAQQQPYGQLSASQPQQQSSQQLLSLQSQQPLPLPQGQGVPQQQHVQQLQPPQQQLQPAQQHLQTQQQLQQQPQSLMQPQSQQPPQQQTQPQQQPLQQQAYYQVPAMQQAQQQPSWLLPVQPQTISSLPPPPAPPTTCEWSEHTSPEGYKYYYNSSTGESKWEKPEELLVFEQQQQVAQIQQQPVSAPQYSGSAVIAQQHPIQGLNYGQAQPTNGSTDQPRQQGMSSVPEWAWKGKAAGIGDLGL